MLRYLFFIFSAILLIYLLVPGPSSINDFTSLPNSVKSDLPGDTIQLPNISGYFSNNYRKFVTDFYKEDFHTQTLLPFSPVRLNYPPEYSYVAVKDQTQTTYLEEFVYPLRDSIYVNGLEPFYEDGNPKYSSARKFDIGPDFYDNKTTLRYYSSSTLVRVVSWLGIVISIFLLWKMGKRVINA